VTASHRDHNNRKATLIAFVFPDLAQMEIVGVAEVRSTLISYDIEPR
jgi:hypothetical protein